MTKPLYLNYDPKENTISLVVQDENGTRELEPVKQTEDFGASIKDFDINGSVKSK